MIWLILTHKMQAAFFVFLAASFSDFLDGLVARLLKKHTLIGSYLDPLADKALLMGLTVALAIKNLLPLWLVIIIVFRDVLIISGAILNFMLDLKMTMQPLFISKLNTVCQMILVAMVLAMAALHVSDHIISQSIMIITGITTMWSGVAYVRVWLQKVNESR